MSTYREAIHHARAGGTVRRDDRIVRFLTREEAEPIVLDRSPSRAVLHDSEGRQVIQAKDGTRGIQIGDAFHSSDGKKIGPIEDHTLVIEIFADPRFRLESLGLYTISDSEVREFVPSDEDIYLPAELDEEGKEKARVLRTDWEFVNFGELDQ